MSARWVFALALVATLSASIFVTPRARAQDAAAAPPFIVGIGRSIHDPDGSADAMQRLGLQSMRLDAPWQSIEIAPGRYMVPAWLETAVDSARARGVEPLLILAYGNSLYGGDKPRTTAAVAAFTRYAVFVTKHFEGRVRYFDLWNEWDGPTGRTTPGTPEDYIALAKQAYPAIKAANPGAVVLSGGIAALDARRGWPDKFVALGGLDFVDGLSVHPYNFEHRDGTNEPEAAIATLERLRGLMVAAGKPKPIYVTEYGYPTFDGRGGVSEDVAAVYLARFMLLASTRPWIAGVWWYCLRDQGKDSRNREHNLGVLDTALRPKPAGEALEATARLLAEVRRFSENAPADAARAGTAEHVVSATRADGSPLVLRWTESTTDPQLLRDLAAATAPDARAARAPRATRPARN